MSGHALFFAWLAGGAAAATLLVGGYYGVVQKRIQHQRRPRAAARKMELLLAGMLTVTSGLALFGYVAWFVAMLSPASIEAAVAAAKTTPKTADPEPSFFMSIDSSKCRNVLIWGKDADYSDPDQVSFGKKIVPPPLWHHWQNAGWQNRLAEVTPADEKVSCAMVYHAYLESFHETEGPGDAEAFAMILLASEWISGNPRMHQWMEMTSDAAGKKYYTRRSSPRDYEDTP